MVYMSKIIVSLCIISSSLWIVFIYNQTFMKKHLWTPLLSGHSNFTNLETMDGITTETLKPHIVNLNSFSEKMSDRINISMLKKNLEELSNFNVKIAHNVNNILRYLKLPYIYLSPEMIMVYKKNVTVFNEEINKKINYSLIATHGVDVVPDLVHFIWFYKPETNFPFHKLVSMLSAHKYLSPKAMILWYTNLPVGKYWKEAKAKIPELIEVKRNPPTSIYGNKISVIEHKSDVVRLEIMLEYGGIYMDTDVLIVKSFQPLKKFDTTLGYEANSQFCNGIIVARRWADFIRLWYINYKTFDDHQWAEHSGSVPARLAVAHPNLIHTENLSLHRPNYAEKKLLFETDNYKWNWKKRNYAIHLFRRLTSSDTKRIVDSVDEIKKWKTAAGQIFRMIYFNTTDLIDIKERKSK